MGFIYGFPQYKFVLLEDSHELIERLAGRNLHSGEPRYGPLTHAKHPTPITASLYKIVEPGDLEFEDTRQLRRTDHTLNCGNSRAVPLPAWVA